MANDIEIRVRVSNQTNTGLTAVNSSLTTLRSRASSAGTSLTALTGRATAAAAALRVLAAAADEAGDSLERLRNRAADTTTSLGELRTSTSGVGSSMRTMTTRAGDADGRLGDLSTRTRGLRSDMDDLDTRLRSVVGAMAGLRGSLGTLRTSTASSQGGMRGMMMAAVALAPALLPVGAAATVVGAQIVAGLGAATVAVGAFGAALIPQILAMGKIGESQKAYTKAVAEHGESSKEATKAEAAWLKTVREADPAVREAAAALSVMKEHYKEWSKSLQQDTLSVATKSFAVLSGIVESLTPTVKGASVELNRFMTIAGGGVASAGFERMMNQFAEFAQGSLRKANDGLVHMMRLLSSGQVSSGGLSEFIQYAKENGPAVGEALRNVGDAFAKLIAGASEVGVSLLGVVSALAKMLASLPTGLVSTLLQLAIAMKAVRLAAAGYAAVSAGVAAMTAAVAAMSAAAAGAVGPMARLTAAFAALSAGAKAAIAATGIGLLVVALMELSQMGQRVPADMEKMTTSMRRFAETGKLSGEAAKVMGKDFGEFDEALRGMARPSGWDQFRQDLNEFFGMDSAPVRDWKGVLEDVDKSLADMVKSGNAETAAQAFALLSKRAQEQGLTTEELQTQLDGYKSALEDAAFEQQLAAEAMGLFGAQAQAVQEKLAAQQASADGLAQSINALNNQYLIARGGVRGMEAAIDAADEALKKNGRTLDENTEKGRANNQTLDDIAAATIKAAESARANGASWEEVNAIYDRGRTQLLRVGGQMEDTKGKAKALANQILRTPDKTARLKGNMQDLQAKLNSAKRQLARVPDSRKARVTANIDALNYSLAKARDKLNALNGKTVTTYVITQHSSRGGSGLKELAYAHGGIIGAAGGGPRSRMTLVGEQGPELVDLAPGSTVHSNPDTRRMFASAGRGDGGPIVIQLDIAGRYLGEVVIDPLRKEIHARGGNVQAVLGRKGA